jgi:hypothetical protein
LVDGKRVGTGQISWEDGAFYLGRFKNNFRLGKGIYIWPSGNVFDGAWENGMGNGMGVMFNIRKKWRYEGQVKDWKWQGNGILQQQDGNFYIGGFKNDKRHGFGSVNSADGQKVIKFGRWKRSLLTKRF